MTKYCPICDSEYQDSVTKCRDDGAELLDYRTPQNLSAVAVDIYAAASEIESERIVSFLNDEDIETSRRQSNVLQLPATGDLHFIITVGVEAKEHATKIIQNARRDGIITTTGVFL